MPKQQIKQILNSQDFDQLVEVSGWVRNRRGSKNVAFVHLNDGSSAKNIQVVVDAANISEDLIKKITVGACLKVYGKLVASQGSEQDCEILASELIILGEADAEKYPLQAKAHSMEFLRENAHLRTRTATFGAIFRLRHSLGFAVHQYFNDRGFYYWQSPIITASDAEGAGETFRVTTFELSKPALFNKPYQECALEFYKRIKENISYDYISNLDTILSKELNNYNFERLITANNFELNDIVKMYMNLNLNLQKELSRKLEDIYEKVKDKVFDEEKSENKHRRYYLKKEFVPEISELSKQDKRINIGRVFNRKNNPLLSLSYFNLSKIIDKEIKISNETKVNFKNDFFGREAKLTVSGQLEAELGALGLGLVYTFGPTFRAENSNTSRHLSEFWMIEPEMAFYEAKDNQDLAEDFLRYLVKYVLDNCVDDLAFLDQRFEKENQQKKKEEQSEMGLIEKLKSVVENDFERLTYTEAIDVLLNSKPHKKKKFKYPVEWGIDLQSEHERFLVEKHFKKPVILSDYPKEIKAFYMKQNEDGKTVRAMDVLFPGIGEIIGGSQREENFEKLKEKTDELGLTEELWWYLDTRRFGTAPHSGFGLGFERLVQFVTGMGNIRDVIPFPRAPLSADF